MYKQEMFAKAKESIFGQPPECRLARIGYNIAVSYYSILIDEAEPILQNLEPPKKHFRVYLKNAMLFSSYGAFRQFPPESLAALRRCSDNFCNRYGPLLKDLRQHQG